ncbi:MAG: penicillin-binding protein activator [Desulfobacterales bacterium]
MNASKIVSLTLMGLLLLLGSCARGPSPAPAPADREVSDRQLLQFAQSAYDDHQFEVAEDICLDILARHPDSPVVPSALLTLGLSRSSLGNMTGAESALLRLAEEHGDHPAAIEGQIALLDIYFQSERFQPVIEAAPLLLERTVDALQRFRIYRVQGDALTAVGSAFEAFGAYLEAIETAPPEARDPMRERVRAVTTLLDGDEIENLLETSPDEWIRGLLTFQLGIVRAGEGKYDEAVWYFSRFTEDYPYHDNVNVAYQLIDQLADTVAFDSNAIGCLLPLSGPYRVFGQRALDGIELAFAELGRVETDLPLRLIVRDSGSDPNRATAAMADFIELKTAAVIGPIATAEAAAGAAQEAGIPILTLTQKEDITRFGRYVFRNFITPPMQADAIVDYAVHHAGMKRFAILYPDEAYGRAFMAAFWESVIRQGGVVVGAESYAPDQADFEVPIQKLVGLHYPVPRDLQRRDQPVTLLGNRGIQVLKTRASEGSDEEAGGGRSRSLQRLRTPLFGPGRESDQPIVDFEALFIPDAPQKVGLIVPHLNYHDVTGMTLFGTNLWHSDKLLEMAGEYLKGSVFPIGFNADSRKANVAGFVQRFEAVYGRRPEFIEAIAYDSARILLAAVLSPDAWLRTGIRHRLTTMDGFDGVTGFTRFNINGEAEKTPVLMQVQEGRFAEIDVASPALIRSDADFPPPPPPLLQ